MSPVATIGTGLSSGSQKLGTTPVSRAGAASQWQFSINQAGRKNVIGMGKSSIALSIMGVLTQQVRFACLCSDSREINNALRMGCGQRAVEGLSSFSVVRKFRGGIEVWRDEHKHR